MRYSITTCICTCFYTDLVNFSNYFKLILFQKRQKFSADFQLHSFLRDENGPEQRSNQQRRRCSRPAAPAWVPAAAAARCPEVLWSDEVGPVSTDTHTHAGSNNIHTQHGRRACPLRAAHRKKRLRCV